MIRWGVNTAVKANVVFQTDEDLLALFRKGDATAFEKIFFRYERRLMAYIVATLKDRTQSEEVLQDIFLALVRGIHTLPSDVSLAAYLFQAAKNRLKNVHRDQMRFERLGRVLKILEHDNLMSRQEPAPGDLVMRLNEALWKLSNGERQTVLLHIQGDLTFQQIADMEDEPISSVSSRYYAAIKRLRRYLKDA